MDDPDAPADLPLKARFQINNGTFYMIDLKTLDSRAIDLSGYDIATPILFAPQSGYLVAIMENLSKEGTIDRYNNYPLSNEVPDCYYYLPYASDFSQTSDDVTLLSMPR